MAVPETDLAPIRRFCEKQVPPKMRDQVRVEHRLRGRTVPIERLLSEYDQDPTCIFKG